MTALISKVPIGEWLRDQSLPRGCVEPGCREPAYWHETDPSKRLYLGGSMCDEHYNAMLFPTGDAESVKAPAFEVEEPDEGVPPFKDWRAMTGGTCSIMGCGQVATYRAHSRAHAVRVCTRHYTEGVKVEHGVEQEREQAKSAMDLEFD